MEQLLFEKNKLKDILNVTNEVVELEKKSLNNLFKTYIGSTDDLLKITTRKKIHISNLEASLEKPYFARIDFTFEDTGETRSIYIGKNGVIKDNNVYVTDWRAPISSLYYDSDLGICEYKVQNKKREAENDIYIKGNLSLKRQFEIENSELKDFYDVDLVTNDNLLQKYLNTNNDSRLKSIVSTIQKEQNSVIRKDLDKNLIIQGVAGSGKTTVALHRIAYLVYNYKDIINQNQYLVIGPNQVFLKYIKSVLPDLDVDGVSQYTYEQFAKEYIDEKFEIIPSILKVNNKINGININNIDKFKCSLKYMEMLNIFLDAYLKNIVKNDLTIGEFIILPSSLIKNTFEKIYKESNSSLEIIIEKTIIKLSKIVEEQQNNILSRYLDYSSIIFSNVKNEEEKEKLRKKFAKEREEIKKNCISTIKKYFKKTDLSVLKMYRIFLETIENYNIYSFEDLEKLKKETLFNIKRKKYEFEDLAALLYLKTITKPERNYSKIKHTVIDEAQDFGEFNFYVLKKILNHSSFSIFGDLAQSIYDYRGIDKWEEVDEKIFNGKSEIINFAKSYRTTSEIMEVADNVAEYIGLNRSDVVVRHGNDIDFHQIEAKNIPKYISKKIESYKNKGYKTIAVISKTDKMSEYINKELELNNIKIPNISINDDIANEEFDICTISNQLAKGLEFDAVIINGADEDIYDSTNNLDMKLLYVALTRALHELDIVYSKKLTLPLVKTTNKLKGGNKSI